jgi:5-methylcytosine-specific restriction endonuclease McrA
MGASLNPIRKYIKARLGYAALPDVSLYVMACDALEKDGYPRPASTSFRQWAMSHFSYIKDVARLLPSVKSMQHRRPDRPNMDVVSPAFLESFEWRSLRMRALKLYGSKCQCCGATPANGAVMNVDHIKPRKTAPHLALELSNLQILCHECNHGKGNWDKTDWRFRK